MKNAGERKTGEGTERDRGREEERDEWEWRGLEGEGRKREKREGEELTLPQRKGGEGTDLLTFLCVQKI